MAFASTAAVLAAMAVRIDALVPVDQGSNDDRYHVVVGVPRNMLGTRGVMLTAMAGRRKLPSRTCTDWETQIEINTFYPDVATDPDAPSVMARAIADAEQILADIYDWAATTDGIVSIDPDLAPVVDDGQGQLGVSRTIRVVYQRTA